jgi:amino-acid N-acetyltransferase
VTPRVPIVRRAMASDQAAIRQMVHSAGLDPFSLDWPNFVVADLDGMIVGIGQVRPYPRCPELGSIVTLPEYRGRGIAGQIIEMLLDRQAGTVYLECLDSMASYYARFGFFPIPWRQAPMPLRLKAGLGNMFGSLAGFRIAVMRRDLK